MTNPYDDLVAKASGQAAPSDNPYDALVSADDGRLRASAVAASGRNPEVYAKANAIAERNGWPVDIVADALPEFEERERFDTLDKVQQDHPAVGEFLSDPRRMALAGDDVEGMAKFSSAFAAAPAGAAKSRGFGGIIDTWLNLPASAPLRGILRGGVGSSFQQGDVSAVASLWHALTDTLDQSTMAPIRSAFDNVTSRDPATGADRTAEMLATLDPIGLQRQAQESAAVVREVQQDQQAQAAMIGARPTLADFRSNPTKATEQFFAYYGNQGAQSLPAMLLALATRNPEIGGAVMGATTGAQDFTSLRLQGVDRGRAGIAAAGSAATEAALGAAGLSATRGARAFTTGPLVESGTEAATTFAQTDLQDWATGQRTTLEEKLSATLDAAIVGYGFGAAQAGGSMAFDATADGLNRAADTAVERGRNIIASAESTAQLQAITDAAANLKLGERSAADMEAFASQVAGEGANVYLSAEAARVLFQSDYQPLQDMVGGADALAEQMALGDVVIPMGKWAAVVSRLPNKDEIVRHGRMSADGLSAVELEGFNPDELLASMGMEPDTADAAERAAPGEPDPLQQVRDDVQGQLIATGRYTPDAAEKQAKVWSAAIGQLAKSEGIDPMALYQRYMGGINDGTNNPQGTRPFQGGARMDALIESIRTADTGNARAMFGPSLSSFLVAQGGLQDQGGELSARDAGKLRPGLVRNAGLELDRARELAVERGYLPEDADLNAFIEALDADLRGNQVFSEQEGNRERQAFDLERQQLLDAISDNDVLRDMPAEQFAALTNQQIVEILGGATLEQAAYHGTPHTVDRFSLQKIGTGEGAQAFGWGLYFASSREIAEHYREKLTDASAPVTSMTVRGESVDPMSPEGHAARLVLHNGKPEMKRLAKQMLADAVAGDPYTAETARSVGLGAVEYYQRVVDAIEATNKRDVKVSRGRLYQVEVPEDSDLLDYDKPLSEQPEKVKSALKLEVVKETEPSDSKWLVKLPGGMDTGFNTKRDAVAFTQDATAGELYGAMSAASSPRRASEALLAAGIPGLRYLDGNSRGVKEGSHNYVIWDEAAISEPRVLFQSQLAGTQEAFEARIDQLFSGDSPTNRGGIKVLDRADILDLLGHGDKPLTLVESAVGKIRSDKSVAHPGMTASQWKRVPQWIENPVAAFESDTVKGRITLIAPELVDGKPVLIVLEPNGGGLDAHVLVNAYEKDRPDSVPTDRWVQEQKLLYLDQKVSPAFSGQSRLRLPGSVRQLRGYKRRVMTEADLVKYRSGAATGEKTLFQRAADAVKAVFADKPQTETAAFKRWFGDSKVVDADGRPLVVYHGTGRDFDTFKVGSAPGWGSGIYFTSNQEYTREFGDRTVAAYVKIENPWRGGIPDGIEGTNAWRAIADRWDYFEDAWQEDSGFVGDVLRELGYDGVIAKDSNDVDGLEVVAFRPTQIKSATGNSGAFDPNNPSILNQQPNPEGPRGQISIFPDKRMSISLFEKADRSTFMHESAHFFLEVMRDLAAQPGASDKLTNDMATLLEWFGVESADQIETKHHEMFARAFEKYLGEGKAPTPELQSAFSAFKAWMLSVYKALVNLNVNLTDDVRGVFDRMLASEAEIEAAQSRQNMTPLVADANEATTIGLTAKQFADYEAMLAAATEEAKAEVTAKLMKAHDRAKQKWWREELAAVTAEVEAEYEATPVFMAARILSGSKTMADGTPIPEALVGLKLDKAALVNAYGDAYLKRLGKLYRVEGGTHPDLAAAMLGFPTGEALVKALANRGDLQARVKAEAADRMRLRHGDPMTDGTMAEVAMDAVHGNKRVRLLEMELALLAKLANQAAPNRRQIVALARELIGRKTARELRPNDYLAAERRAAQDATKAAAKGDYAAALLAKRQQAFNAAMYAEARKRQADAARKITFLKKAGTDKTRKRVGKSGKSYVEALDALMEGHELRTVSGTTVARREALRAWIARVQESGSNTSISEELLARVESERVVNVADLTFAQLDDLHESVKNLLHLARMKNLLRTKQGQIRWKDAKRQLVERLEQQRTRGDGGGIGSADQTALQAIADLGRAAGNWVLQPETIIEWLDGGTSGPWHDILWEPSEDVEHVREALQRKVGALLQQAFDTIPAEDRKALDQTHAFAWANRPVSGHTILAALMNAGNDSNYNKLLQGGFVDGEKVRQFTPAMLEEMFATLTESQAHLVQGVWDAVNSLWPDIVALEEKMNGFAPPKVEPRGFTVMTKGGLVEMRGGYFPVKYDPRGSKVGALADDEQAKRVLAGQGPVRATTSKGHTVKRTEFTAPLLLDYHRVLSQHLDGVMGDIAYREFLPQVYRVLNDPELSRMVHARLGPGAVKALKLAFERGAVGATPLSGALGPLFGPFQNAADNTLTNISSAALGLRVPLALANTVTAPMLATARVSPKFVAAGFFEYYKNPRANARMVQTLSPMMLKRSEARSMDLRNVLTNLRGKYGLRRQMIELSMSVHQWIVPLAENAIWMGAYKQAQAGGADTAESIRQADKAIRQTQTKHTMKDLATAEGNPYLRPLMQFVGPLVIVNNRLQESGPRGLRGDVTSPMQAVGVWLAMAAGGAWAFELMMGRGADDEDDDGEVGVDDWSFWAAKKLALLPFAAYPILREATAKLDSGYSRPNPLVDAINRITKFGGTAFESGVAIFDEEEEVDAAQLVKDTAGAAGVAVGVPSNQLVRTGTYLVEVSTGEHAPTNPAAEAVYLLQGPPKDE